MRTQRFYCGRWLACLSICVGWLVASCQSLPPCSNQIGVSTLDTNGRGCGGDCDCNNQRFVGRCVQEVCQSVSREPCFRAGQKRYCELSKDTQLLDKRCGWGVQICQDEGLYALFWGDCKPQSPADKEISKDLCVDGIDNDCNGRVDFYADPSCKTYCLVGRSEPCYDWKDATPDKPFPGYAVCRLGTRLCKEDNTWGPCLGALYPEAETCDGKDNDCNGQIDEGVPNCKAPEVCKKGQTQPCYNHVQGCVADGKGGFTCQGSCKTGLRTCKDDNTWGECIGQIGPSFEDCNQVDDNCDGTVDEGCICSPNATQPCYAGEASTRGKGRCVDGLQKCQRGFWGACESSNLPRQEECNGEDDDCNGVIDDPEKLVAPPCEKRLGVCFGAVKRCGGAQGWLSCTTEDYRRVDLSYLAEDVEGKGHCDGKDNDCDGQIDEGCSGRCVTGSVKACYSGPQGTQGQGICREGLQIRQQGVWGDCLLQVLPTTEICNNNLDDDCNGKIDDCKAEATPELLAEGGPNEPLVEALPETPCQDGEKRPCSLGGVGVCGDGQATCSVGTWGVCLPIDPQLDHEKCDGKDNNCNGLIDEAFAIRPRHPLCKDQQGACAGATLPCTPDVYEPKWSQIKSGDALCTDADYKAHSNHVRRPAPTNGEEDRCDNLDNDCDGQVDEGCPWIKVPKNGSSHSPHLVVGKDAQNRDVLYVAASIASAASTPFELDAFSLSGTIDVYRPFAAKYDASGNLVWAFAGDLSGSGTLDATIRSVALDPTQRWLYVLFDYVGSVRIGNQTLSASDISGGNGSGGGGRDVALLKLNAQTGALVWATNLGGLGDDQGRSVHVDAQGDIYLSVLFTSSISFHPNHLRMIIDTNQTLLLPTSGLGGSAVIKLTEGTRDGELQPKLLWLAQPLVEGWPSPNVRIFGQSLATDSSNNVWWIGYAEYFCGSCPTHKVLRFGTYALSFSAYYQQSCNADLWLPRVHLQQQGHVGGDI
ncbi:hypothetical protein L6R29_06060 [Myxococcota bacterium]|nr:hypothetical protein [Myxococcota bacterium]